MLGVAVIVIAALLMLPPLQDGVDKDRAMRAWEKAESIAWAVTDYREDTGNWPQMHGNSSDLSCLTRPAPAEGDPTAAGPAMATLGTIGQPGLSELLGSGSRPWLQEIPLDSWDRPFNVWILDQGTNSDSRTVVVISAGPDGVLQTDPTVWPASILAMAGNAGGAGPALVPEGLFLGDDVGFILPQPWTEASYGGAP